MTNEQGYGLLKQVQKIAKPFGYVLFGEGWFQLQITKWDDLEDCKGDQTKQKVAYNDYRKSIKETMNALLRTADLNIKLRVLGWDGVIEVNDKMVGFGYPFPAPDFPTREQTFNVKQAALYLSVNYSPVKADSLYWQLINKKLAGNPRKIGKKTRWLISQSDLDLYGKNRSGQPGNPNFGKK